MTEDEKAEFELIKARAVAAKTPEEIRAVQDEMMDWILQGDSVVMREARERAKRRTG